MADPRGPRSTDTVRDPLDEPVGRPVAPGVDPIAPTGAPVVRDRRSTTSWIWIAVAIVVILLLLWWFFGFFGNTADVAVDTPAADVETVTPAPAAD